VRLGVSVGVKLNYLGLFLKEATVGLQTSVAAVSSPSPDLLVSVVVVATRLQNAVATTTTTSTLMFPYT